ncbi:MAG TPA: hypothetical protein VNM50_08780, partial [Chloroflexota bacterium]|nr:hypothetical protein [Chloroflexota bacterium]
MAKADIGHGRACPPDLLSRFHLAGQHDQHVDIGRLGVKVAPRVRAVQVHPAQPLAVDVGQRGFQLAQRCRDLGRQRRPRPLVPKRKTIDQYSDRELRQIAEWVISDGLLRTDE